MVYFSSMWVIKLIFHKKHAQDSKILKNSEITLQKPDIICNSINLTILSLEHQLNKT